jgi:hypothetical protein
MSGCASPVVAAADSGAESVQQYGSRSLASGSRNEWTNARRLHPSAVPHSSGWRCAVARSAKLRAAIQLPSRLHILEVIISPLIMIIVTEQFGEFGLD